jgi:cyanophycin synthetase
VLETARGGILRRGLGYDYAQVAVVTNISSDHIGQDGLETIEDIAYVKGVVAEQVLPGGTLVLNADDPHVREYATRAKGHRIAWFTLGPPRIPDEGRDIAQEVVCYAVRKGWLVEVTGGVERRIVQINSVRATLGGAVEFQVANALAAAAAARACGLTEQEVAAALRSFNPVQHNPGRSNLYKVNGGYVLLDYGHNAHGLEALGHALQHWTGYKSIGVIEAPGDRADWVIQDMARQAAAIFDRIIVYDPDDLRGRKPGEVPALIEAAVHEAGHGNCEVIEDGVAALRQSLDRLGENEILVYCYENLIAAVETLEQYGAVPVSDVPAVRADRRAQPRSPERAAAR